MVDQRGLKVKVVLSDLVEDVEIKEIEERLVNLEPMVKTDKLDPVVKMDNKVKKVAKEVLVHKVHEDHQDNVDYKD